MKETALLVAGMVFLVVSVLHLARLFFKWEAKMGRFVVPVWASAIGFLFAGALSLWMFAAMK